MRIRGDGRIHLQAGRGHAGHQQPVLGVADLRPAALRRPTGVDEVFLPDGVGRRRLLGRDGELRVLDRLHGEQQLPQQPSGGLAGVHRDLDRGQVEQRREEPDPHRVPAERVQAQPAALLPAAHEEERLGRVGPQEVAVHRSLTLALGFGDAFVGDRDRLLATTEQVQDGGQVGVHAEQIVQAAERGGLVACPQQHLDRRLGFVTPGLGHGQRARGVEQFLARRFADFAGHFHGFEGVLLGLGEDALEHPELRQGTEDARPGRGGLAGDQIDRALVSRERSLVVAGGAPVAAQPLHHQAQGQSLVGIVQGRRRGFAIGLGPGRIAGGERGLGGPHVQVRERRHGLLVANDLVQVQRLLVVGQGVRSGVERLGGRGRG